jgi:hypothetical protein
MTLNNTVKIIAAYFLVFVSVVFLLNQLFIPGLLAPGHFLNWDAQHYYWISQNGYEGFRVAFFPLFPFVWKGLSLGIHGITIFNAATFLVAFFFLVKELKSSIPETVLYLSIPSFLFFFLPYSEAVFFASSTLLIIGMKKHLLPVTLTGLIMATLARPAFTVLVPALILAELLGGKADRKMLARLGTYVLVAIAGTFLVILVQYLYTGSWFGFPGAQKDWGNELQWPKLPLTSWAGGLIVRLDAAALLTGLTAGVVLLILLVHTKFRKKYPVPKEVLLSLGYLAGITLSVLAFRGGSLFSLNRFVFSTPFIIVALNYFLHSEINFTYRRLIIGVFTLLIFFTVLYQPYVHIRTFLNFVFLVMYMSLILSVKSDNPRIANISFYGLMGLNLFFQVFFFTRFLSGGWVG